MGSSEADFCAAVMAVARGMGLLVHWCSDSRKCYGDKGFPDLVIAGPRGLIFAECKMPSADTTAEQDRWIWTIGEAGGRGRDSIVRIWFPSHLENGTIERELQELCATS